MTSEQEAMVVDNLPLVRALAANLCKRMTKAPRADVEACGYVGLVEAAHVFDARRGVQFSTFAYYRIQGAMLDGARRSYVVRQSRSAQQPIELFGAESAEKLPHPSPDPERALIVAEQSARLRRVIATLPDTERHLVEQCWLDDRTLEGAGRDLGLSKSWASRLLARAERKLRACTEARP